jgi:hypothetical protein
MVKFLRKSLERMRPCHFPCKYRTGGGRVCRDGGVAGLIKDKAAVSNKLAATKVNVPATARAKFSQRQTLRRESSRKISAISKEKVAARI